MKVVTEFKVVIKPKGYGWRIKVLCLVARALGIQSSLVDGVDIVEVAN